MPANDAPETAPVRGLTRREVAVRLNISVASVRRMEGKALHPAQDDRGVWRFSEAEVAKLPPAQRPKARGRADAPTSEDGRTAGRVFEAFSQGYDLREIVIGLQLPPALVRELYAEWVVSLEGGEQRRRIAEQEATNRREQREWERSMRAMRTDR